VAKCKDCNSSSVEQDNLDVEGTIKQVMSNMPSAQPQVQVKEKVVRESPPEMKLTWCPDCSQVS